MNNIFLENTYKWINWITVFNSGIEWKTIAISAVNHWNEPVWLKVFDYLVNDFKIHDKLKSWKVLLIAVNIEAYKKYLGEKDYSKYRFINHNMNRIWNQEFQENSSEFKRMEELKSILIEVDILFDIHSVPIWEDVIWISDINNLDESLNFFDVEKVLIDEVQKTGSIVWYMHSVWKKWFWLESWNHISNEWYLNWVSNVMNLLSFYWLIWKDHTIKKNKLNWVFNFMYEIIVKTNKFKYVKRFPLNAFHKLNSWEIIAFDWNEKIIQNYKDKEVYIGFVKNTFKKWDWAWFLFEKIK